MVSYSGGEKMLTDALSRCSHFYIDGKWVEPSKKDFETFEKKIPTTGETVAKVAQASKEDVDLAVAAARKCLNSDGWGYKSTGAQRAAILRKLGKILKDRSNQLAKVDCYDNGKPMREALADMGDAVSQCEHFADLAEKQDKEQDESIDVGDADFKVVIRQEPIGVVGCITPWNFPFLMAAWKVIPAIAAGCTIVLKPSELAPLSCLLLADMTQEAGLPAGAFNVVNGLGYVTGAAITNHPGIDKVSFTGSRVTAQKVMAAAAAGPRGVSLELGGKSPLIVFEDCAEPKMFDAIVDWVLTGVLWGSGQVCSSTSRVLVHESLKDKLIKEVCARTKKVPIGDTQSEESFGENPWMGPVINETQYTKIWNYIDEAKANGYNVACGGDRALVSHLGKGYYIPGTVIVDPPTDSRVWQEEIFGPVLCIRSFATEEEAVTLANDTIYGLASAVFSTDLERCSRVSKALRSGIVWINNCQPAFIQAPWGGVKGSGFGRELGRWGLEEFTAVKQITSVTNPGYKWDLWG
jgi:betaine-aldehyde dehydrogenase|eukprot:g2857.t1